jgi:hypothetical protein
MAVTNSVGTGSLAVILLIAMCPMSSSLCA